MITHNTSCQHQHLHLLRVLRAHARHPRSTQSCRVYRRHIVRDDCHHLSHLLRHITRSLATYLTTYTICIVTHLVVLCNMPIRYVLFFFFFFLNDAPPPDFSPLPHPAPLPT